MRKIGFFLFVCAMNHIWAEGPFDKTSYEAATGLQGTYNEQEKTYKVSVPRTDVKISVSKTVLDPFMGLASWFSFTKISDTRYMGMGDLLLFQDEVNPVISTLLNHSLKITALHNHFFYDDPKIFFMHVAGDGDVKALATGIKMAFEKVKELRKMGAPSSNFSHPIPSSHSIDIQQLETIFGIKGQSKEGMVKFVFGRMAKMDGIMLKSDMGINSWAAFGGMQEDAFVDGDLCLHENELQPVLKILREGNINIVAIHNHMTMESPRLLFLHYWGQGSALSLAQTIKKALDRLEKE